MELSELKSEFKKANIINPAMEKVNKAKAPALEKRLNISDFTENTVFSNMLKYYDAAISSPFEFIVTNLITISSGVIGRSRYIDLGIKKQFLNLYSVVIGGSTMTRKTTAIETILRDLKPLRDAINERNKAKLKDAVDNEIRYNELNNETLIIPESTAEALFQILSSNFRGVQIHKELKNFNSFLEKSYNQTLKSQLTDIYDGGSISTATKGSGETAITEPFLSILAASTIEWFSYSGISADLNSGWLNRFLFCRINENTKPYIDVLSMRTRYNDAPYFDCKAVFERLYNLGILGTESTPIDITSDAAAIYTEYDLRLFKESKLSNNDTLQSFYGRLIISILKIAGIIALINNHSEIMASDVKDAITLGEFYKHNLRDIISSGIAETKLGAAANKVITAFKSGKQVLTRTEIFKIIGTSNDAKFLDAVLSNLIELEQIEVMENISQTKNSKPKYRFIGE